ncbi:YppF family protein [Bacillus sp. FJAT-47783]|uniref:YppF family protein n=1 Tax=Bacillus sp. FJAT-47783 TaxID=2922712 RepID=UPI001FACDCE6|nr:YppF family protein [Bacillus sp. FJAT-47783]
MNYSTLKEKFKLEKQYDAYSMNELLDYLKKLYIREEITILEYRQIIEILEKEGAKNPEQAV